MFFPPTGGTGVLMPETTPYNYETVGRRVAMLLVRPPVLRIRIRIHRIHMFLGLLDPDPDPSIISKNSKKKKRKKNFFLN
jgi:hypothetical protein